MNKKTNHLIWIDLSIIFFALITGVISYNTVTEQILKICITILFASIVAFYGFKVLQGKKETSNVNKDESYISVIRMLNEEGKTIKEWDLYNQVSIVIGRNTDKESVDIDLTDCKYASLIEHQHAVLNFAQGEWYIEDLYSKNGIKIQKSGDATKYQVSKDKPCKVGKGDMLHIAKTRLLIQ